MEILHRFAPLMSATLHCTGSPEGLNLPLDAVQAQLFHLAEEERTAALPVDSNSLPDFSEQRQQDLEQCRFAVYAWVDEQILNSPRQDAPSWLSLSLQCRYLQTSEAGKTFYDRLAAQLDHLGLQARAGQDKALHERLEEAAALPPASQGLDVLCVFALCLLYGFRGSLHGEADLLARLRKASLTLLSRQHPKEIKTSSPLLKVNRTVWHTLEPFAYVLFPALTCLAFALYCANILSSIPIKGF